jgi:hypothetical protein
MNPVREALRARSAALLRQSVAAQHAEINKRLPPLCAFGPDEILRARQAAAGSIMAPLTEALPAAARIAMAGGSKRVCNPKIWETDTKRFRGPKFDTSPWLAACRFASGHRVRGDVLKSTIDRVCQALAFGDPTSDGRAKRRMTHAFIAGFVGCEIDTVRKVVRLLERVGLIDTFNVLRRTIRGVFRAANMYLLRMPDAPAVAEPTEAPAAELGMLARMTARLERWAPSFDLKVRAWGLNATPVSWQKLRTEPDSTPA